MAKIDRAVNSPKIRYYLGSITLILGLIASVTSFAGGIAGLSFYYGHGDLLRLGNRKAGPGVAVSLILEGFLMDLVPSLATAFLGFCIRTTLSPTMKMLKRAKAKVNKSGNDGTPMKNFKSRVGKVRSKMWDKFRDSEAENNAGDVRRGSKEYEEKDCLLDDGKESKLFSKFKHTMESYASESPKYLFYSLFLMAGTNLGMAMTCFFLAGGMGAAGMPEMMKNYGEDQAARRAVDWVQATGECCGEETYTEWFTIKWCTDSTERAPTEHAIDSVNICPRDRRSVKYDVPASCCSPPRGPCLHDALDLLGLGPLHTQGCEDYLKELLNPKYKGLAWYHVSLSFLKLILVVLVFLLKPAESPSPERGTDEEASNLLPSEENPSQSPSTPLQSPPTPPQGPSTPPRSPSTPPRGPSTPPRGPSTPHRDPSTTLYPTTSSSLTKVPKPDKNLSPTPSRASRETKMDEPLGNAEASPKDSTTPHHAVSGGESATNLKNTKKVEEEEKSSSPAQIEPSLQETHRLSVG